VGIGALHVAARMVALADADMASRVDATVPAVRISSRDPTENCAIEELGTL
jgi:hypothetical protein